MGRSLLSSASEAEFTSKGPSTNQSMSQRWGCSPRTDFRLSAPVRLLSVPQPEPSGEFAPCSARLAVWVLRTQA
ncbi:MAG: hypothetical protein M2R45_01427 [Verrucomicrobia subdivision 3 bacterium]|nr:hypothetical protein [Limisphaerales bacterium]MCS1417627.1 hypothetical protein [Limisphaerales bacterium]